MGTERSSRPFWLGEDRRRFDHARVHLQLIRDSRIDSWCMAVYLGLVAHAEVATGDARPSMETLAGYGQMSARKVASCIATLAEVGYIEVEPRDGLASMYHLLPPPPLPLHVVPRSDVETHASTARGTGGARQDVPNTTAPDADEREPGTRTQNENPPGAHAPDAEPTEMFASEVPRKDDALKRTAHAVTVAVFEQRDPRPAAPFPGVMKVARMLLVAGHTPAAVIAAMVEDGAMTVAAVEFRLGRARERAAGAGPSPRQQRKAAATDQFVAGEQPTGRVGAAFYRDDQQKGLGQ